MFVKKKYEFRLWIPHFSKLMTSEFRAGFSTAYQSKNSGPFNRYSRHNEMRTGNSSVRCGVRKFRIYICSLLNSEKAIEPNSRGLILIYYCGISLEVQRNAKNVLIVDNPGEILSDHLSNRSRVAVWDNFLGNRFIVNISRLFQECSSVYYVLGSKIV